MIGSGGTPLAIFAHNEEAHILRCLESIKEAAKEQVLTAFVLINGSADRTAEIVDNYARQHPWVRPMHIQFGDKSNAWNLFVHEYAPVSEILYFMDGDVRTDEQSLAALKVALELDPAASAAAAVPGSGRNRANLIADMKSEGGLAGNLYALRGTLVDRIKKADIRLPIGFIGEDGLVGALVAWDLDSLGNEWSKERIAICENARFYFDSLSIASLKDWRLYYRRRANYSLRHIQNRLLREILISSGVRAMPECVEELYSGLDNVLLPWRGIDTFFDRVAMRRLRKRRRRNREL